MSSASAASAAALLLLPLLAAAGEGAAVCPRPPAAAAVLRHAAASCAAADAPGPRRRHAGVVEVSSALSFNYAILVEIGFPLLTLLLGCLAGILMSLCFYLLALSVTCWCSI
jgi:hypothetical protein